MISSPSPRSPIPPAVVLEKLWECEDSRRQRHRRRDHCQAVRSSSMPRPQRQRPTFRPFSLTSSMERNLQNLHRIGKELEDVNRDLSEVIDKQKHSYLEDSLSDTSSLDECSSLSSSPEVTGNSLYSAVRDFEMADLAYEELLIVLADIKLSYQIEAKELIARASYLKRESETFKKMSSEALANLSNASNKKY